ncbi:nucleotidyl transferase AbiEii/AbiGii toxin family protein [Streptomyces sp. NPDC047000]|uniref:nucleotidyl transferase AbiEii/AbiGii toxin family protein n=1 Tax=Streptomyces sp. NPDC047000 TaxID=3155474 RepID=UPI0033CE8ABD
MTAPPSAAGPGPRAARRRDLLTDVLVVGAPYALALTGGQAVRAHGLVERVSRDVDVATESQADMASIAGALRAGLTAYGWSVRVRETAPLAAGLLVTDPATGERREVTVAKETLWRPPVSTGLGPALALEDVVGTKVRALADRGLARDLVDVHAAAARWTLPELEELGRRHAPDVFDLADLAARLTGLDWIDDTEFTAHGLDDDAVAGLRRWAQAWADDIAERLVEGGAPEEE